MGNRIDPGYFGFGPEGEQSSDEVGEGFYLIGPDLLVEKGDEYRDDESGHFVPFPLEAIGRPVPAGLLARRPTWSTGRR